MTIIPQHLNRISSFPESHINIYVYISKWCICKTGKRDLESTRIVYLYLRWVPPLNKPFRPCVWDTQKLWASEPQSKLLGQKTQLGPGFWGPILGSRFLGFRTRKIGDWLGWSPEGEVFRKIGKPHSLCKSASERGSNPEFINHLDSAIWILLHISVFRVSSKFQEQEWNPIQHDGKRCRVLIHH